MSSKETRTPREINAEILSRLDVAAEFEALGVRLAGREPRQSGMLSAYAFGRDDRRPSAWVNVRTGFYGDSGGAGAVAYTCSLWDLAAKAGKFATWQEARKAYAEKAGVLIGKERAAKGESAKDWRERLEFQPWDTPGNEVLVRLWCQRHKPGVTLEAIQAAGGTLAYYRCWVDKKTGEKHRTRDCRQVIAIPAYGRWLLESDPVAWVLWDVTGQPFDVTPPDAAPTDERVLAKMISCGLTSGTTIGLSSLMLLADAEARAKISLVWKVEGPADLLTLWAAMPDEQRETVAVVTGAAGATADIPDHQAKLLAWLRVAIVGDCDAAGQAGAAKWAAALDGVAAEVRIVPLPWPVKPKHGEDVRDYLTGLATPAVTQDVA